MNPWWLAIRPKTLPASISPILLGSALAASFDGFNWLVFLLAMLCAVSLQIAVNLANDFFDAKHGIDSAERLGPVRVTQSGLIPMHQVKLALLATTFLALVFGLLLVSLTSAYLLIFGALSIAGVYAYSAGPFPLASHGLGEITVLFFFGFVAVGGSFFAHTQTLTWLVLSFGFVAGLISAAIMLVNNIRDIPTDRAAGKHTLAVKLGEAAARRLYVVSLIVVLVIHALLASTLSWLLLVPLLVCIPFVVLLTKRFHSRSGRELNLQLADTAKLVLVYCGSVSATLLVV